MRLLLPSLMQITLALSTASGTMHPPECRYLGGVLDFTGELNRYDQPL